MATLKSKIPPQAIDIEQAVIGACLIDSRALDDVFSIISNPDVFYDPRHNIIFKAISNLYNRSLPVDLLTVPKQLNDAKKLSKVGGNSYLIELSTVTASGAHVAYHSRIILQKYIARKMIDFCTQGIAMAYDSSVDVFDLIDTVSSNIDNLTDTSTKGHSSISWHDAVTSVPKRVEFLTNNQGIVTGIPTGLAATDKHFNGWQNQDLIIIGADNGMGKTAFVLGNMIAAAKANHPVGMFSMEMSVTQLAIRAVSTQSQFHMNQLMRTGFEHDYYFPKLTSVVDEVKNYSIHIDDQPALTVPEMKRKARSMKRKYNIKLLVIDFVQMFSGDKDIRINISEAARELKNIAKELDIPVIALSQLSRDVKNSRYKIPSKHHLKESSAIEEAADIIGLLYRPKYYGYTRYQNQDVYQTLKLKNNENACLIVAKNRNGALGNVGLHYIENKTKYVNPQEIEEPVTVDTENNPINNEKNDLPF